MILAQQHCEGTQGWTLPCADVRILAHRRSLPIPRMTPPRDEAIQAALDRLLKDHSLDADTRLYREAMRESLAPTDAPGVYRLAANAAPSESVVDIYGNGYLMQAE